jgi:hypothetical protein
MITAIEAIARAARARGQREAGASSEEKDDCGGRGG